MNRIEKLRQAMHNRLEELQAKVENLDEKMHQLPNLDGPVSVTKLEAETRELNGYRAFFDSFATDPIKI